MAEPTGNPDGYLVSKRYSMYVFSLLFLLYMFDYMDRQVVVSLFPYLKSDWGLTDMQCGALVSAVYWSILIFSLPVSLLIDRWSRKNCIGFMAVLWSIATATCAFTRSFGQLFAARTAIGIGEAGYAPGGTAMISALFPQEKRAQIMGLWNASIPLGSALGVVLGGVIAQYWGWRHAFGVVALPGLVLAVLFFRVKDYRTVNLEPESSGGIDTNPPPLGIRWFLGVVRELLKTKSLVFAYLGFAANMFVNVAFMSWLPTFYHRTDGTPMSEAGMKGGLVMAMAIVGAPLGGWLADRWNRRQKRARLLFGAITSVLTGLVLFSAFAFFEGGRQYGVFLLGGTLASAFVPGVAAVTQDVVHPGIRATAYALNVIVMHILGSSLGPIFVGAVSDRHDLLTALTILPLFSLLAGLAFLLGSFFYVRDVERVAKVDLEVAS